MMRLKLALRALLAGGWTLAAACNPAVAPPAEEGAGSSPEVVTKSAGSQPSPSAAAASPPSGAASQPGSPGSQPAAIPGSQPSAIPSSQPGSQPAANPAPQPDSQPAANPASQPGSQPAAHPGSQPGSQPSSGPASSASLPPDHSTSSEAVALDDLFRMPDVKGEVVMTVGPHKVLKAELEQSLRVLQIEVTAAGTPDDLTRYEVLRGAVDRLAERVRRRLLAAELGVKLDPKRVKAWLHDLELRIEANPSFKAFLSRAGKDAASRRKDAEDTVLWQQVEDKVVEQVLADSEDLARKYYDSHKKEFVDRAGVEAWRILIQAPRGMVQRDRDIAQARAEKVHARAKKDPDDFENLARQHSAGGKGPHGGYLGYVSPGSLAKNVEDQIFTAKPNTILPIIEAPVGYYIYKVGKARKERTKPFDAVKVDILRKVYPARISKRVADGMKKLRDKYPAKPNIPELAALQKKEQARIDAVKAKMKAMSDKQPPKPKVQ